MPLTKKVSIESPYNNKDPKLLTRNINYAIMAMKDACLNYKEAPYLSHLLNTQCVVDGQYKYVSDDVVDKYGSGRDQVIEMINSIRLIMDAIVFYIDFGYSSGMLVAKKLAEDNCIPIEERKLPKYMFDEI